MNLYLYSQKNRYRISWASTSNDFELLCRIIGQKQSLHQISKSLIMVTANDEIKKSITQYCLENEQQSKFNSRKIDAFVSKLMEDECFFILNADETDDYERLSAVQSLDRVDDVSDRNDLINIINGILRGYTEVRDKYNIYAYGIDSTPVYVGEPDKEKRICRFCRKPQMGYKDVAHAIPEALGNTKLFCNEECDNCNHRLKVVEDNFIALMDIRRAMFKIKRKGTSDVPNIDGQNFVIRGDEKGNPTIYYMEEELPNDWQNMDLLPIRLNLKYRTTNENIYKALCKFVLDLLPSHYVNLFSETIDWICSEGRFIPDSLPSCYLAIRPNGVFYKQPQLYIYVKKDPALDSPFCFALLNIYDVTYRFIVPFSSPDAGKYRTDESLVPFWNSFQTKPALTWYKQDTFEWWSSAPWAEFDFRKDAPFFVVKPSEDPIFANCRDAENPEEWQYDDFNVDDLDIRIEKLICKCQTKERISQERLRDTTVEFSQPLFSIYEYEQILQLEFTLTAKTTDNKKQFLKIEIIAMVALDKFLDQVKYEHLSVNGDFTHAIWDKLIEESSRMVSNKLKYTQFSRLNPLKDFTAMNHRFMRETMYVFHKIDGRCIRMPYKCAHEEMSESKRIKLFQQANMISKD